MPRDYTLNPGDQLPAFWLNEIQEYVGALAPDIRLIQPTLQSLRIAGSASGQKAAGVSGLWRFVATNVDATHPGGAVGIYDVVLIASANSIASTPAPFTDNTDYKFYPKIVTTGSTPTGNTPAGFAIAAWRKIGECDWDGTNITGFRQLSGANDATLPIQPSSPSSKAWALRVIANSAQDGTVAFARFEKSDGTQLLTVFTTGVTLGSLTASGSVSVGGGLTVTGVAVLGANSTVPTATLADSTTKIASTAFVWNAITAQLALPITLAAGTTAVSQLAADSTTKVATTAFAQAAIAAAIAAMPNDGAAGTATRRTLGASGTQAAPGNDSRFPSVGWTTFTPNFTASITGLLAVGNGAIVAKYMLISKMVYFNIFFQVGTTTNGGRGSISITLPTASSTMASEYGAGFKVFANAAGADYVGYCQVIGSSTTAALFIPPSVGGFSNADASGAVGTGNPSVPGGYAIAAGSNLVVWGAYPID